MSETFRRKQIDLPGWELDSKAQMLEAFGDLMDDGWRGGVNPLGDNYRLEISKGDQTITADIGDRLVNDLGVRKLTAEECAANYDVGA